MDVISHLGQQTIWRLNFFGIDLSITNGVISLWSAVIVVFGFFFAASRNMKLIPGSLQNAAEVIVLFIRDEVASVIPENREKWTIFIIAVFTFILVNNLLGIIPGVSGATGNINTTAALAIIIFIVVQCVSMIKHGPLGYLRSFLPSGIPLPIAIFLLPVEIISMLAKPFSLAVRLFANVFTGHAVMFMLISLIFIFKSYFVVPFPVIGNAVMMAFEIFIAFIQAFIFTYLSTFYIASAYGEH